MSDVVFEVEGQITLDADDVNGELEQIEKTLKEVEEGTEGWGENIKSSLKDFGSGFLSGIAEQADKLIDSIPRFVKSATEAAAEIEAQDKRFTRVFGDLSDDANQTIQDISKTTNIYGRLLKDSATKSFQQFSGAGIDATTAIQAMEEHLQFAADAAAYYSLSVEQVNTKLLSFYRGNVEAGDQIGLFTSQLQRDTKALEKYGVAWKELDEAQRQLVMMDITRDIFEQGRVLGTAAENGDDYTRVLNNFKTIREEIRAQIGKPLLMVLTPILDTFNNILTGNPEKIEKFVESIGEIADKVFGLLLSFGDWVSNNSDSIIAFIDGIADTIGVLFGKTIETKLFLGTTQGTKVYTNDEGVEYGGGSGKSWAEDRLKTVSGDFLLGYTDDQYKTLNDYIHAVNEGNKKAINELKTVIVGDTSENGLWSLYEKYITWRDNNEAVFKYLPEGNLPYLPAEVYLDENSKKAVQDQLDALDVKINASVNPLYVSATSVSPYVTQTMNSGFVTSLQAMFSSASQKFTDGSHDKGLPYVPYDGYVAELHRGEAVLTELQNAQYRNTQQEEGQPQAGISTDDLISALRDAFGGISIQMDKQTVGTIVSPVVFREMGRQLGNKRFAT